MNQNNPGFAPRRGDRGGRGRDGGRGGRGAGRGRRNRDQPLEQDGGNQNYQLHRPQAQPPLQQAFNRHDNNNRQGFRPRQEHGQRNFQNNQENRERNYQQRDGHGRDRDERNNDNAQRNRNERNDRSMGFRALEEIAHCNDQDIIAKVNERSTLFLNLLASEIDKTDMYILIMEIMSKVCKSTFFELKRKLLLDICNSRFIANLRNYVMDLPYATLKSKNNLYWNNQNSFWGNFITFCEGILDISPTTALQKCRPLIEGTSRCCLELLKERHGFDLAPEHNAKLQQLRERMTMCEIEETEKEEKRQKRNFYLDDEHLEPPESFRQLSVVPTHQDLMDRQPFLRPNIVNGGYRDTEHYLDVQFRLLREDCFGPLRDGIAQFMENPKKKKYDNIRVYQNVKFIGPFISKNKIGETIQLDEKTMRRMKNINWAHSKRFIFGSLLLFTKDNCKSFVTATILEREVKLLTEGKIPVSIVDKVGGGNIYNDDTPYIMIESEVYFEPYVHVLKALQEPKFPEDIAMSKYIIHVDPVPKPPAYLTLDSVFAVTIEDNLKTKFRVLNEFTWPTKDDLSLNETQYEAYKLALTHEFAVIQGPPGTGKTHLGVKVAKTLLENLPCEDSCLMLVICYTNHALDQFLENILKVTDSIVRIGGQSRNEAMENINLTTLRKSRKVNFDTKRLFFEQKNELTIAVRALQQAQQQLDSLDNGVISFNSLKDLPEVQNLGEYYAQYRKNVKSDPLKHWLFEYLNYVDFNNVMCDENPIEEIKEESAEFVDEDDERIELILDEFEDGDTDGNISASETNIQISFSIKDIESKLKTMMLLYNRIKDTQKQHELQLEIVDLKSRANLFYEMTLNRNRQTRLRITNRNVADIPMVDRWAMYFRWANTITNKLKRHMKPLQESLESANTAYEEARMMVDLKILKGIKVIGMTTSGAARLRKLLQALAPSIVIVEEAAEVLEQHIVTSLTKSCQHLILIGDHQQLRPSAAHMKLARHFNIEISLFERMITNGIHSRRLGVQHRMRPEVAALISPHIYPDLANHPSVLQFPNVRGVTDNLFFMSHNYKEEEFDDSASKSNKLEADLTLKLANYLMQQGYEPADVTILTAYSGQMFYMRKQRENYKYLKKVKITVVDNYQGEESKIILLSLVRNNDQNKIGFLGTENRVCVALSRAKEGFYMFGNIDILKRNSELWKKIALTLEQKGLLGTSLMLKCESHPEQITMISSPKDFQKVPEGGCLLKCNYQLPCGHGCTMICHGYDRGHVNSKCHLPCERVLCELGHVCPAICAAKCQPCKRMVRKDLPCGHTKMVYCYKDPADPSVKCDTIVRVKLPKCGHEVDKRCHEDVAAKKCPVLCVNRVERCGHECLLTCHVDDDPHHENYKCMKACSKAKMGCMADLVGDRGNHQCTKRCYETCEPCTIEVTKKRSKCKHSERVPCNTNVDDIPCRKKCARVIEGCNHFCMKKCFEPCGDCKQKVKKIIPGCKHEITVACMTPATRALCREQCERILSCGHRCTKRCDMICDSTSCTQLITRKLASPCGHQIRIPCNVYATWDGIVEVLLKYCTEPCGAELACEHVCGGTCGGCHQGRLHLACTQQCNRTQICGHLCNVPCNQVCPPCNNACYIKCPHSRCNKTCGEPCTPCQEPCTRKCQHSACTRRCGEPCDRAPCDSACPRALPCGHPCRGLCGEPCPDICRTCAPDRFPTDFLGDPYDDDVKFVKLEDCTHYLDVDDMDNLMMGDRESISIRVCPHCRAPVVNTQRYKDLVNRTLATEINPIKERVYGNDKIIKQKQKDLFTKVLTFYETYEDILEVTPDIHLAVSELHKLLKTQKKVSLPGLETQYQYLEIMDMIVEYARKYIGLRNKVMNTDFHNLVRLLCSTLIANIRKISQQLQEDIGNELKRINSLIQLEKIFSHPSYLSNKEHPKVRRAAEASKQVVLSWNKFEQNKAVIVLKEFEETIKVSGIVTKEERDLIVRAIGSKAGSWYKCPNGHFYTIGQCGGAMQVSKCADCGAHIGGQNHTLLNTNAHAGEVDGSEYAAWSDRFDNMANWQLD